MSFRSLLEAAMGKDELPAQLDEYENEVAASGLTYDPDAESGREEAGGDGAGEGAGANTRRM
jgi:hypothetical protein